MSDAQPGAPRGAITIRRSLVRNLVLLIVATATAVLGLTIAQSMRAVEELSVSLVRRSTAQVDAQLRGFFTPVRQQLHTLADWGREGLLTPMEPGRLTPLFLPILARQPQVSSLILGDEEGHGYMLLEQADHFRHREVWRERWGRTARWGRHTRAGRLVREWSEELDYDPRDRPWYVAARAARGTIAWTEPYAFFTTQEPGITASTVFRAPDGEERVVGLDVLLSDVSTFTTSLDVSEHGAALVLADDGRVIGLPRDARYRDAAHRREAGLTPLARLQADVAGAARRAWAEADGRSRVFATRVDGERFWAGVRRVSLSDERTLFILVLVPERDFLGHVNRQRNVIIAIVGLALVLAVLMALWLARGYSRPLEALALHAERMRLLDLAERPPVRSRLKEVRELSNAQERMRAALESFSRYVPLEVVRELIRQGEVAKLGGRTARLSVLFSDIVGFTTIAERMTPTELTAHMGRYFDALLPIVGRHGGTVDKLIGDAIMAFFGAPVDDPDHARHALETVLACRARLAELEGVWTQENLPHLPTRFGLHTGEVVVGNVGSHERLSYTVLGDTVNLASRLEGAGKGYGVFILASSDFKAAVGEGYVWRFVDRVSVKGREEPVEIFEPLGREGEVSREALAHKEAYEEAFARYAARDFEGALEALAPFAEEPSSARLRERCEALLADPPPEGWAPAHRLTEK